jgi:hypothetical protein
MSFRLPAFNLEVDIYRTVNGSYTLANFYGTPDITEIAQLNVHWGGSMGDIRDGYFVGVEVKLPALTDVRPPYLLEGDYLGDYIDVPAGSGRMYLVKQVDDVAKGFTNEYRSVLCIPAPWSDADETHHTWPTPIP